MNATIKILIAVLLLITVIFVVRPVRAESQDACAIWLCLPGGFPQGCAGAYSEFKHRIKKGRPPLPSLSSCSVDGNTDGRYELGYERYEPCEEGYELKEIWQDEKTVGYCYDANCINTYMQEGGGGCANYKAVLRAQPYYVKMWVSGEYLGQFFYQ